MIGVVAFILMIFGLMVAGEQADSTGHVRSNLTTSDSLMLQIDYEVEDNMDNEFNDWMYNYYFNWLQEAFYLLDKGKYTKMKYGGYHIKEGSIIYIKVE